MKITVREALEADAGAIQEIYSHYVLYTLATMEDVVPDVAEIASRRKSILAYGLPYLVAEIAGNVVGYAYAAPYRARGGYRFTIEDSIYVEKSVLGKGVGSALLSHLIHSCQNKQFRQMIATIGGDGCSSPSMALHEKFDFQKVGTLQDVGFKNGRSIPIFIMQRSLLFGDTCDMENK